MPTPTEPGWYWWTPDPDDPAGAVRLPTSSTFEAMRELLATRAPIACIPDADAAPVTDTTKWCVFCGKAQGPPDEPERHDPDCFWLRAQEKGDVL